MRRLAAAATGALVCLCAGGALAQSGPGEYVGRWSVSGDFGYAIPNTDQYSGVFTWRAGLYYGPTPSWDVGLEAGSFTSSVVQPEPQGLPSHDIASGTLAVVPVCLTLRYHVPLQPSLFSVTLLGGAGYYFVDYTMAEEPRAAFAATGGAGLPDQAVDDAFGFHLGAGLAYALTGWCSLTVEGRYQFLSPDVSGTAGEDFQLGGSLNLNTWLFTGGIRLSF